MIKKDYILILGCITLAMVLLFKKEDKKFVPALSIKVEKKDTVKKIQSKKLYGMVVDNMHVVENKIKPNESLSQILSFYNVSFEVIHDIAVKSKSIFDLGNITAHKKYALLCTKDSAKKARYFIYEPNEYEYVVCDLNDSIKVSRHLRQIDTVTNTLAGEIESSLFESMVNSGARPEFVYNLAEVFKWQIDFYRVQKGDKFKVIFEELLVDGKSIGMGKIIGAYFNHESEDFYGIAFDQGNGTEYFDENGKNLQKAFLKAPLKFSRISSRYTLRRFHPVTKRYKAHLGTDYAAPRGTPIHSVGDGVVIEARYTRANGNYVKIRHDRTYTTQYLHMSKRASGMKPGRKVKQGETIGYVGSTGLATGPHLCFRFWKNGRQVDALKVKIPPTAPVKEDYKEEFDQVKVSIVEKLNNVPFQTTPFVVSSI